MSTNKLGFILVCAFYLTSCSLTSPEMETDWKHGAKHAWVVKSYDPSSSQSELPACLSRLDRKEFATRNFIQIRYHHAKRMLYEVAELPADQQVNAGDELEVWPEDCTQGKLSRISRVLKAN